jgi:hypothetical protein
MIEPDIDCEMPVTAAIPGAAPDNETEVLTDRRRPGRTEVSPVLLPLLRGESAFGMPEVIDEAALLESDWDPEEPLRPARGIAFGLLLSLPLWAALLATCHVAIKLITHS